jgi:RNA polymerase sigma-70 factor (sigma-E family)
MERDRSWSEFERFVAESGDGLLRTAFLLVADLSEAEDLVQETFMRVAGRWRRVSRMEHPVAYARRILVNLATDGARRRSRRREELAGEPERERSDDGHGWSVRAVREELVQALATLPARQRSVLVLRYFLDLPEAEVARTLGCSLGSVKSSAARGLSRLEQRLQSANAEGVFSNG